MTLVVFDPTDLERVRRPEVLRNRSCGSFVELTYRPYDPDWRRQPTALKSDRCR